MRRTWLTLVAVFVLLVCFTGSVGAAERIPIFVNGRDIQVEARLIDDRTFVPLRAVSEALDAAVLWDEASGAVYITSPDTASDPDAKRFLSKPRELRRLLLILGDIIETDPTVAAAIGETIEKHVQRRQPQTPLSSSPQEGDAEDYYTKMAEAQKDKIRAEAEAQRQQIRAKAKALREQAAANADSMKAQVENYYRTQKQALDSEKQKLIREWAEEFNRRGVLQSGMYEEKVREINAYYDYRYRQLEDWRWASLKQIDDTQAGIDRWEADGLRQVDAWEARSLQEIDDWLEPFR